MPSDKVTVDNGALTDYDVATDTRTINSVSEEVQRVVDQGSTAVATAQTNISSTAATLIAARETRKHVTITNRQLAPIFVGPATVTAANGFQIDPGASLTIYTTALLQAITSAASGATEKVHTVEVYDS